MSKQRFPHLIGVLTAAVALSGLGSVSVSAARPQAILPDVTHPNVMQQAAREVATAKVGALRPFTAVPRQRAMGGPGALQREVFGFALASSLSDPSVGYPTWDFTLLSTVAFFGLHVQDDGHFAGDSGAAVWNSSQLSGLLSTAHSHGTKVVVTIILQDFGAGTPHMCSGLMHGTTTVNDIVAEVKGKGVDGVNLDYEGLNGACGTNNPSWARDDFRNFTALLRSLLPAGSYLSVDSYASSAADPLGFFDVAGLNAYVDSFFVMAYDLEYSNYARAPTGCVSFCLGPTAPLSGYYYNDTNTASQYVSVVGASKVILGVPYYGRKSCVAAGTPNQYPTSSVVADSTLDASAEASSPELQPGTYVGHRDANDPAGQERWDTWFNTTLNCTRELYWDDVASLGQKYALVNSDRLRGVGIWTLNYGGGAPELWSVLNTAFSCAAAISLPATEGSSQFAVPVSAGGCSVAYYDVQQFDSTLNQGWFTLKSVVGASGAAVTEGYPSHTYQFRVRAHTTVGGVSGWATASTTVAAAATNPRPFAGMYSLDAYGGVYSADSAPLSASATWPGWSIARSARAMPGSPQSGAVLDGFGGLHSYGAPITIAASAYWQGWDIARDFAFLPNGTGGVVLDGWGGLHPFHVNGSSAAIAVQGNTYWPGTDVARKVAIFADGSGGYVMDAYGGLHPFGINGPSPVSGTKIAASGYWAGWSIARDIVLVPGNGNHSGYVLDGWGGLHPFHVTSDGSTMPAAISTTYWPHWDIARGVWLLPGSATAGWTMDGFGGLHPFGGAPAIASYSYFPGQDVARSVWGG